MSKGLIIAAPSSGSGKTTLTLALLRHLRNAGARVAPIKTGPDYIDPAFHAAASGRTCFNLDPWAMRRESLSGIVDRALQDADLVLAEGVMGLFDGAAGGAGSTAALAAVTGWPVVLIVDVKGMSASAAALVHGFATFNPDVKVAGVIFNRVGSPRHADLLEEACAPLGLPILGHLSRREDMVLPSRHLGLVQAAEHPELDAYLDRAATQVAEEVDIDALLALASGERLERRPLHALIPPLGQRIAVARDEAFAFCYPALLESWQAEGVELSFFSPLNDEAPDKLADAVYLPGGYPELHVGKLGSNRNFFKGLQKAAEWGVTLYGECGGYMVLGQAIIDARGDEHEMAGLLPVTTSFAQRKRSLGYRQVRTLGETPLGAAGSCYRAHEFHYTTVIGEEGEAPLFAVEDAAGRDLGTVGAQVGSVIGSYIHLIDAL